MWSSEGHLRTVLAHIHGMSVGDKYYGEKYNEEDRICQGDVWGGGDAVGMSGQRRENSLCSFG